MNDPCAFDVHASYRHSQLLREAETYRAVQQSRAARRSRDAGELRSGRGICTGWRLRVRLLIGLPAEGE